MKKIFTILVVIGFFLSAGFVYAEEEKAAEEKKPLMSYEYSVSGLSQFVGATSGGLVHDKVVIQSSFTVTHNPSGLYLNLWGSYSPKGGFNSDSGDEIDYTIGIARDIGPVNVDFYYSYYNLYRLDRHGPGDVHALGTKIKFPKVWALNPYLTAEYYFVRGNSSENGLAYRIGADFTPIEKLKDLKVDVSVAGHTEVFGAKAEAISSAKASVKYEIKLAENLKLTPEVNFQKRLGYHANSDGRGLTKDRIWGGLTFTWTF